MYETNKDFASFSESDSPDSITLQNDMRLPASGLPDSSAVFSVPAALQASTPIPRRRRCNGQCGGTCGCHKKQGMGDFWDDLQAGDYAALPGDVASGIFSNPPMLILLGVGALMVWDLWLSSGKRQKRLELRRAEGEYLAEVASIKKKYS